MNELYLQSIEGCGSSGNYLSTVQSKKLEAEINMQLGGLNYGKE